MIFSSLHLEPNICNVEYETHTEDELVIALDDYDNFEEEEDEKENGVKESIRKPNVYREDVTNCPGGRHLSGQDAGREDRRRPRLRSRLRSRLAEFPAVLLVLGVVPGHHWAGLGEELVEAVEESSLFSDLQRHHWPGVHHELSCSLLCDPHQALAVNT